MAIKSQAHQRQQQVQHGQFNWSLMSIDYYYTASDKYNRMTLLIPRYLSDQLLIHSGGKLLKYNSPKNN